MRIAVRELSRINESHPTTGGHSVDGFLYYAEEQVGVFYEDHPLDVRLEVEDDDEIMEQTFASTRKFLECLHDPNARVENYDDSRHFGDCEAGGEMAPFLDAP